jgi:hypothetical protein
MVTGINQKNMFSVLDEQQETQKTQVVEQKTQVVEQKTQVVEQKTQVVEQKTHVRSTFKGREATPLVRKAIQKTPNNVESRDVKEQTHNNLQSTKFVVATRYLERGNAYNTNTSNTRPPRPDYDPANYTCTKACTRALLQENGKYGVCTRTSCTFAHSLDELRTTICRFDASCKTINGTYRSDWTIDTSKVCRYQHSNETKTAWSRRTGQPIPALPQTKICQPDAEAQTLVHTHIKQLHKLKQQQNLMQQIHAHSYVAPTEEIALTEEIAPQSLTEEIAAPQSQTEEIAPQSQIEEVAPQRPTEEIAPQRPTEEIAPQRLNEHVVYESRESYNHVFPSQNFEYSPRRNRSLSPVRHNYEHVITVPTKELAEVVVKSMFDREIYNFRIILG